MGNRTYQRILECDICGRIPEDGEPMWSMGSGYWCEPCCDKPEDKEPEIPVFKGTWEALNNLGVSNE
jgi:hypothetical protein